MYNARSDLLLRVQLTNVAAIYVHMSGLFLVKLVCLFVLFVLIFSALWFTFYFLLTFIIFGPKCQCLDRDACQSHLALFQP